MDGRLWSRFEQVRHYVGWWKLISTVSAILTAIDTQINTLIASPDDIADYKIGEKTVNKSQILSTLLRAREVYQKAAESEPYEDVRHIALDFDHFGVDISEMVGDLTT